MSIQFNQTTGAITGDGKFQCPFCGQEHAVTFTGKQSVVVMAVKQDGGPGSAKAGAYADFAYSDCVARPKACKAQSTARALVKIEVSRARGA